MKEWGAGKVEGDIRDCQHFYTQKLSLNLHSPSFWKLILHLEQKTSKCVTCKWLFGKF